MIADRIEGKWIDLFAEVFARCKVAPGDACAIHCTIVLDGTTVVENGRLAGELA